jgi:hypothetical protein
MSEKLPVTRRQLERALGTAVRGLRALQGTTGGLQNQNEVVQKCALSMLHELGIAYDGYHALDELLRRFVDNA